MLKRALLLQLLLLFAYVAVVAQPKPTTYEPVKSTGNIPADMLIKSSKKYEVEKSTISRDQSKKDRKNIESFYLSANFEIDKLLLSGMVSFNDPITNYLNRIIDVLLKDEPELRKLVRVYTMKSTVMNAFATNQGIIFVNVGLLARVKNEAELAFVLAHEITHIEEKHSLNKYLKVQTIERDKDLYKGLSLDDKLVNINHYSRELETEADEKGLKRYLNASYSLEAIDGSFTALSYSHTPYVEYDFDYKWLESATFSFPQEFWREKVNPLKPLEDNNDSTSTHPSIQQRKHHILSKVEGVSAEGRKLNIVSTEDFDAAVQFAQFEVCRLHLASQNYDLAIYEAQALLKSYPNNLYLQKVTLKALAALAYVFENGIYKSEWAEYINKELQGNAQRCYHFNLSLATNDEYMASVATRYAWQLKLANPQDNEINTLTDSLMHLLFYKKQVDPEFYSLTSRGQTETDSIALAYDKLNNPEKYNKQDSLLADKIDTSTLSLVDDTNKISIQPIRLAQTRSSATSTENNTDISEPEPEDTFYVTSVSEAKMLKIKLTGYEKYMLKNKEKYDILGVKKDGTFVYRANDHNDEPNGVRGGRESDTRDASDKATTSTGNDGDTTAAGLTEETELYLHEFEEPLDNEFHKYAFVDFANDPSFFKEANKLYKLRSKADDYTSSKTGRKKVQKEEKLNKTRGYALNIKKVVIINPRYSKINLVNPEKQQYLTSEKNQKRFSKLLKTNAKISGIKHQVLDNKDLKNKEVATFNDIAFLNEWLDERIELGTDVPFSTLEQDEREALVKKYGTRYFMWTGNISVREQDYRKGKYIAYSIIFPPILPFMLPNMIKAGKYQIYYYLVYDVITNEMVLSDVVYSNQVERNDFLNSQVYYTFNQLKFKR